MQLLIDEEFLPFATNLISNALHSIDISTFKAEITTKPRGRKLHKYFDLVIEKSRLGIPVRFLINTGNGLKHIPITNLYAVGQLKANKVKVRKLQDGRLCHAKIIIVDSRYAVIGSHNLSIRSCHNNFECSLACHDPEIVKRLSNVFTKTFESARGV